MSLCRSEVSPFVSVARRQNREALRGRSARRAVATAVCHARMESLDARRLLSATVTGLTADAGPVASGQRLLDAPSALVVSFSSAMSSSSVQDLANWQLLRSGSAEVSIQSVTYNAGARTATLAFASPVPTGTLRLTAKDTLKDAQGKGLDGDFDGVVGGAFTRSFVVDPLLPRTASDLEGLSFSTAVAGTPLTSSVAVAPSGRYAIAGARPDAADANSSDVAIALFSPNGQQLAAPEVVNGTTFGNQLLSSASALGVDGSGNFVLVWQDGSDAAGPRVWVRRYDAAGAPRAADAVVSISQNPASGSIANASVAVDSSGAFTVLWQFDDGSQSVLARRFNASGVAIDAGEVTVVAAGTGGRNPVAAYDGLGKIAFAYQSADGAADGVFVRKLAATGTATLDAAIRVNPVTADNQIRPSISSDGAGLLAVSWTEVSGPTVTPTGFAIRAALVQPDSSLLALPAGADELEVGPVETAEPKGHSVVRMDASGDFAVVWSPADGDSFGSAIKMARYNAAGGLTSAADLVNAAFGGDQVQPSLGITPAGDVVVSYGSDTPTRQVLVRSYAGAQATLLTPLVGTTAVNLDGSSVVSTPFTTITVPYSKELSTVGGGLGADSVTNAANWTLTVGGVNLTDRIENLTFGFDTVSGQYRAVFTLTEAPAGSNVVVTLTPSSAIRDVSGYAIPTTPVSLTVNIAAPTAAITTSASAFSGDAISLSGLTSTAPGGGAITAYEWDLAFDGVSFKAGRFTSTVPFTVQTTPVTVALRVKSAGVFSPVVTRVITPLDNVAPTLTTLVVSTPSPAPGQTVTLSVDATDPSSSDTAAGYTFAWTVTHRGSTIFNASGPNLKSISFFAPTAGDYAVSITATDRRGATSALPTTLPVITVSGNTAPVATINPLSPVSAGGTIVATAQVSDDSDNASALTYAWALRRNGAVVATANTAAFTLTPTVAGPHSLELTVTDTAGASATATPTTFTVASAAGDSSPVVSVPAASGLEGTTADGSLTFTFTLSAPWSVPVSFNYAAVDGTALAGTDYVLAPGTVTFAPGSTTATVTAQLLPDAVREDAKSFTLSLTNPSGLTLPAGVVTATVLNDDVAVSVIDDPINTKRKALLILASDRDESILVRAARINRRAGFEALIDGVVVHQSTTPFSRVIVFAAGGNDTVSVTARLGSEQHGGDGNDTLTGGSATDILVGGLGADSLTGTGNDLLISGAPAQGTSASAFSPVSRAWVAGRGSFAVRLGLISRTLLTAENLVSDNAVDVLNRTGRTTNFAFFSQGDTVNFTPRTTEAVQR